MNPPYSLCLLTNVIPFSRNPSNRRREREKKKSAGAQKKKPTRKRAAPAKAKKAAPPKKKRTVTKKKKVESESEEEDEDMDDTMGDEALAKSLAGKRVSARNLAKKGKQFKKQAALAKIRAVCVYLFGINIYLMLAIPKTLTIILFNIFNLVESCE